EPSFRRALRLLLDAPARLFERGPRCFGLGTCRRDLLLATHALPPKPRLSTSLRDARQVALVRRARGIQPRLRDETVAEQLLIALQIAPRLLERRLGLLD